MLTPNEVRALCDRVIAKSPADHTELMVEAEFESLTRLGDNVITQNVASTDRGVRIRVQLGQKEGVATANQFDDAAIGFALDAAVQSARLQTDNPEILPPVGGAESYPKVDAFAVATAECSPDARTDMLAKCVGVCKEQGLAAGGIVSTGYTALTLANSAGLFATHKSSNATLSLTATDPTRTGNGDDSAGGSESAGGAGWASDFQFDVGKLKVDAVAQVAVDKAIRSRNAVAIEPGDFDVVLEPAAVSDLIMFLNYLGMNGLNYVEGRSFLAGKIGEKIFSDSFTLTDDPYHERIQGIPFDFEGLPRRSTPLIENGVLKTVCHDRKSAKKAGIESTGHGLPQPSPGGGFAFALAVAPGDSTLEEMVADTKRGLYVTQFHYNNVVNPMEASITGMTRNGTWLIEDGKIARPVRNLRYTESLVSAFRNIAAITKTRDRKSAFFGGSSLVPGMKINQFHFSSATDF